MRDESWQDVLACDDPESVFNLFLAKLDNIYHNNIPTITKQVPSEPIRKRFQKPPWMTNNVLEALNLRNWFQRFSKYYPGNVHFTEQCK